MTIHKAPSKTFRREVALNSVRAVIQGNTENLMDAFVWWSSPQGHDYWSDIYDSKILPEDAKAWLQTLLVLANKSASHEELLANAHQAAAVAVQQEAHMRPEDSHALDRGFAWVTIPGRSALAVYCRHQANGNNRHRFYGGKNYPTGWHFWCPGGYYGQSIRIHEVGAKAFREVFAVAGISATMQSRLD